MRHLTATRFQEFNTTDRLIILSTAMLKIEEWKKEDIIVCLFSVLETRLSDY